LEHQERNSRRITETDPPLGPSIFFLVPYKYLTDLAAVDELAFSEAVPE
jgi:hypothetical protein